MSVKIGIGNKLFFGFASMIVLSIITSVVLWDRFQDIADTQKLVIEKAIPAMNEAQQLVELSAGIIASAPELAKVTNEWERESAFQEISSRIQQVEGLLADFDRHGVSVDQTLLLKTTIKQVIDNVTRQDQLVESRLRHQRRSENLADNSIRAVKRLSLIAESLVANMGASTTAVLSTVYDLVEPGSDPEEVYEVLDRLIEVEFDGLERMFELRLRASILGDQIQQLSSELHLEKARQIDAEIQASLKILGRRIDDINDPGRFEQADEFRAQLTAMMDPANQESFLATRLVIIRTLDKVDELITDNHNQLEVLNRLTTDFVNHSQQIIQQSTSQAKQSVYRAGLALILFGVFTPIVLLVIFSIYVSSIISRITTLESGARALAEGDYSIDIDTRGSDELSEMAHAVQVFKENSIEKVRLDRDLKNHKKDLEKTVKERTLQLEETNQELKEIAAKHEVARKQAEQASRTKSTFLAMMSHEIRTPMNGILGTLRLLGRTHLSKKQRYFADVIDSATRSLLDILNDVLDFSSIEAGKIEISRQPFDVGVLVEEIITLMRPAAEEKGLFLDADIDQSVNRSLLGDPGKLRQVLLNLVNNAIKFTEQGGVTLKVFERGGDEDSVELRFEVADTGIGIDEGMIQAVFEPFTQVDTSLSKKKGGIGLGLAICQRLVIAMGGSIFACHTEAGGACMTVDLKFAFANEEVGPFRQVLESSAVAECRSLTVLLVEDDDINRMVSQSFLEEFGHQVTSVMDAETAIEQLENMEFDILLTDISLPGMDGLALTKVIRELKSPRKAQIPIVAISAHVLKQEVDYYQSSGITAFLGKPYEPEKLNEVLQRCFSLNMADQPEIYQVPAVDQMDCRETLQRDAEVIGFEVVDEMVTMFASTSLEVVTNIGQALENGDYTSVAKLAHKLKGAASSVGLHDLWQQAEELESLAIHELDEINVFWQRFEVVYQQQCELLQQTWAAIKPQ